MLDIKAPRHKKSGEGNKISKYKIRAYNVYNADFGRPQSTWRPGRQVGKIKRVLGSLRRARRLWGSRKVTNIGAVLALAVLILSSGSFGLLNFLFSVQKTEAATTVFTETFSTTTYRDAGATPANWDTAAGNAKLPNTWTKMNGTVGYDNISNNSSTSQNYQFQINSSNYPFVVWADWTTGAGDIYFSKWNGTNWVKADGTTLGYDNISNNSGTSNNPKIQLDSTGNPFVIWEDGTTGGYDIYFTKWNGSNWTKADGATVGFDNLSNDAYSSLSPQFQLDSTNKPFVAWVNNTAGGNEIY
ncbi:MAG: hypothetical protein AAB851_02645, partial [Patescibacteria group bacterium]